MLRAAWQFRGFLGRYRLPLLVGATLVVLMTLADLAQPWPLQVIVDHVIRHRHASGQGAGWLTHLIAGNTTDSQAILIRALIALAALVLVSAGLDFLSDYLMSGAGQRVMRDIRNRLFAHLQRLSLAYHDRQRVGDLTSRLSGDMNRLQDMLIAVFDTLIPNVFMLAGLAIAMLIVDWRFGLLALSIAPPLFFVTFRYTLRIKQASRRAREAETFLAAQANETLAGISAVQAFGREELEDRRFSERSEDALAAGLLAIRLKAAFPPMVDIISLAGTILVTYVGVRRVVAGQMSLGVLLVFLSYLRSLYRPMRALSKLAYLVSRGIVSAERVRDVLNADERLPERPGATRVKRAAGAIEFDRVTFAYEPGRAPVLQDLSVRVEAAERVGIVGPTGVGKSTFVSLIPRFYDPTAGRILLDGADLRELELASLRAQVSLVLQEPLLFYGSILDNIRYGDPTAPIERVLVAAEAAHVTEFLPSLPNHISTVIGERGATLSGGQRQRLAIARAMLRDAPILILDEPTVGLDAAAERLVLDALRRLSDGRTTFVISHHEAPLLGVDRILVMPDAREQAVFQARVHAGRVSG
jgi:subfamily B ATP-binding cassette protein MsbA